MLVGSTRISNLPKYTRKIARWSSVLPNGIEVTLGGATYVARNIAHNERLRGYQLYYFCVARCQLAIALR
jgi:hypothetical protein